MKSRIHLTAALVATTCVLTFWLSTVISEVFYSQQVIVAVKSGILYAMWMLVPAIATAGITGFVMGRNMKSPVVDRKKRRMPFIALNGLLVLLPAAIYLHSKAVAGEFDTALRIVQGVELLAGAANLTLMGLNLRDGLRLTRRGRRRASVVTAA